jgi:hypothetical protein
MQVLDAASLKTIARRKSVVSRMSSSCYRRWSARWDLRWANGAARAPATAPLGRQSHLGSTLCSPPAIERSCCRPIQREHTPAELGRGRASRGARVRALPPRARSKVTARPYDRQLAVSVMNPNATSAERVEASVEPQ